MGDFHLITFGWGESPAPFGIDDAKIYKAMEKSKSKHGGARVGAGRKRDGVDVKGSLTVRISPSTLRELERQAAHAGKSKGAYIEALIHRAAAVEV